MLGRAERFCRLSLIHYIKSHGQLFMNGLVLCTLSCVHVGESVHSQPHHSTLCSRCVRVAAPQLLNWRTLPIMGVSRNIHRTTGTFSRRNRNPHPILTWRSWSLPSHLSIQMLLQPQSIVMHRRLHCWGSVAFALTAVAPSPIHPPAKAPVCLAIFCTSHFLSLSLPLNNPSALSSHQPASGISSGLSPLSSSRHFRSSFLPFKSVRRRRTRRLLVLLLFPTLLGSVTHKSPLRARAQAARLPSKSSLSHTL